MNEENHVLEINLSEGQILNESFVKAMGARIQSILKAMMGGYSVPVNIKGSKDQIKAFSNTLNSEKKYLESYRQYGLDHPMTLRKKFELNKAVDQFERKTGIPWSFRS